jgi:3-hydroxybutyrate dehydrogenase
MSALPIRSSSFRRHRPFGRRNEANLVEPCTLSGSLGARLLLPIASVHGLVASVDKSAYVASKHGVVGLTKVVALETATTAITCNAICPGRVLTPLAQKQIDALAAHENLDPEEAKIKLLSEKKPSLEFITPEQLGALAVFLCSDAAVQLNGVALPVDGDWLAR